MKKLILLLAFTALSVSCSDDDDNTTASLRGSWQMTSYVAYMDNLPQLNDGDITWFFSGSTLTVENNVLEQYPYMMPGGEYNVQLTSGKIYIDGQEWNYTVNEAELRLIHPDIDVDGGPNMTFEKINL